MLTTITNKSCFNPIDKFEGENEDSYCIRYEAGNLNIRQIAMCDGAGGVGIYCQEWAKYLTDNQPDFGTVKSYSLFNAWFLRLSEAFYEERIREIPKDPFVREKFTKEGSFSTFLYLWHFPEFNLVKVLGCGDSCIFVFGERDNDLMVKEIYPINFQNSIDENPRLLNWAKQTNFYFEPISIEINKGDIIILATDAISRWLLGSLMVIEPIQTKSLLRQDFIIDRDFTESIAFADQPKHSFKELVNYIIQETENFDNFLIRKIEENVLEPDDFTIMICKCE